MLAAVSAGLWTSQVPALRASDERDARRSLAFAASSTTLAKVTHGAKVGDGEVVLVDLATGKPRHVLRHKNWQLLQDVTAIQFSADGKMLAVATIHLTVSLWDVTTGKHLHTFPSNVYGPRSLAFSPDGKFLAVDDGGGVVLIWDLTTWKPVTWLKGHAVAAMNLAYSADGKMLAVRDTAGTITFWELPAGKKHSSL